MKTLLGFGDLGIHDFGGIVNVETVDVSMYLTLVVLLDTWKLVAGNIIIVMPFHFAMILHMWMTMRSLRSHAMKSASVGVRVEVIGLDQHRSMMEIHTSRGADIARYACTRGP